MEKIYGRKMAKSGKKRKINESKKDYKIYNGQIITPAHEISRSQPEPIIRRCLAEKP